MKQKSSKYLVCSSDAGKWEETTLGEVARIRGGKRLPKGEQLQVIPNTHPYIRITDIQGNRIKKSELLYVPDDIFPSIKKYIVNENDIILSIVGTIGLVARIPRDLENASLTENCVKLTKLNNVDNNYLFYYLISKEGQEIIMSRNVGSTQPKLPIYNIEKIDLLLPPLPEQKAIAAVLSSFDDKIELLREQNKTLEATAQAIFKEWFIDFEFPVSLCHSRESGNPDWIPNQVGDDRKGYKSSGGKMVDSELGPIPEAWQIGTYEDLTDVVTGKGLPKDKIKSKGLYEILGANGSIGKTDDYLFNEDLIVTGRVGTLGNVYISKGKVWISDNVLISKPKKWFYFTFFNHKRFNFESLNRGSTQPLITQTDLKNVQIIMPNSYSLERFEVSVKPIFNKMYSNNSQIQTLSKIRDTLLSKLMHGELRVEGFNKLNEI